MNKPLLIAFVLLASSFSAFTQVKDLLESFNLVQNGNTVIINFSIKGGASCNGVTVQRRLESDTEYTTAAAVSGICGGSEFVEHYTVVDEAPLLGNDNIYRLILGTQGNSAEKSIVVVELVDDYKIYPQPADDQIFISFNNPNFEDVSLSVYNLQGEAIIQDAVYSSNLIYIDGRTLSSGVYLFQLEFSGTKLLTGKFLRK